MYPEPERRDDPEVATTAAAACPGVYSIDLQIVDVFLRTTNLHAKVVVADAPLVASGRPLRAAKLSFAGVVATVIDRNPLSTGSELRASIDWGDGHRSAARVSALRAGTFVLTCRHHYARPRRYSVVIRVADVGGSKAIARSTIVAVRN